MTQYTHTVTIAVPAHLISDANHLALLLGESAADIDTFKAASYTDGTTNYAVAHTVVKSVFGQPLQTGELPPTPEHAKDILDRDAAQRAFGSILSEGGILIAMCHKDDPEAIGPHEQFALWGLSRIPQEDELL